MCWTLQRLIDSDEIRFPGVEKWKTPQGSNANMRIFKDPLPDHASGSKGIPINALEVDEPPSHPRYHSGDHEKVLRIASSRRYRFATVIKRGRSATEKGEIAPIDLTASDDG